VSKGGRESDGAEAEPGVEKAELEAEDMMPSLKYEEFTNFNDEALPNLSSVQDNNYNKYINTINTYAAKKYELEKKKTELIDIGDQVTIKGQDLKRRLEADSMRLIKTQENIEEYKSLINKQKEKISELSKKEAKLNKTPAQKEITEKELKKLKFYRTKLSTEEETISRINQGTKMIEKELKKLNEDKNDIRKNIEEIRGELKKLNIDLQKQAIELNKNGIKLPQTTRTKDLEFKTKNRIIYPNPNHLNNIMTTQINTEMNRLRNIIKKGGSNKITEGSNINSSIINFMASIVVILNLIIKNKYIIDHITDKFGISEDTFNIGETQITEQNKIYYEIYKRNSKEKKIILLKIFLFLILINKICINEYCVNNTYTDISYIKEDIYEYINNIYFLNIDEIFDTTNESIEKINEIFWSEKTQYIVQSNYENIGDFIHKTILCILKGENEENMTSCGEFIKTKESKIIINTKIIKDKFDNMIKNYNKDKYSIEFIEYDKLIELFKKDFHKIEDMDEISKILKMLQTHGINNNNINILLDDENIKLLLNLPVKNKLLPGSKSKLIEIIQENVYKINYKSA